jgi:hypothetical protein
VTTETQVIWILMDHEGPSNNIGLRASQFNERVFHPKFRDTFRIKTNVPKITDVTLFGIGTTVFLSIGIKVTTRTHTSIREIT